MSLKTKKMIRFVAAPVFVLGMGLPALVNCSAKDVLEAAQGCDELKASDFGASLGLDAHLTVFMEASGRFSALGEAMVADTAKACQNIAIAAGGDASKWAGKAGSDLAQAACDEASAKVTAAFNAAAAANVTASLVIVGGECSASLSASGSCNAKCDVSGKCSGPDLQATCDPGKLSGSCSGMCSGSCDVQGGSIDCTGTCGGTCTGTCAGNCNGTCSGTCSAKNAKGECIGTCDAMCTGSCSASCTGKCEGSCSVVKPGVQCTGTCHGACDIAYTAPSCDVALTPPKCTLDADCAASCEASVSAQATCTPPSVTFAITGDVTAVANFEAVIAALEVELPALIVNFKARGQAAVDNVKALVNAGASLQGSITGGKALACIAASIKATAAASVNVSVSVNASASVGGSAGAK